MGTAPYAWDTVWHRPTPDRGGGIRVLALIGALAVPTLQLVADAHAAPATMATAPWLDARPAVIYVAPSPAWRPGSDGPIHLVRYDSGEGPQCGVVDGDAILELKDDLFSAPTPTGRVLRTSDVQLLSPLSSEQVGTLVVLEQPGAGSGLVSVELELPGRHVAGPDEHIELMNFDSRMARGVLVLVAAGRGSLLGVTGGTLINVQEAGESLALGPSLVRGSDLALTHGVSSQAVAAAEVALSASHRRRGDLVLLPLPQTTKELRPGTHQWVTTAQGIGELQNRLSVGLAAGEA